MAGEIAPVVAGLAAGIMLILIFSTLIGAAPNGVQSIQITGNRNDILCWQSIESVKASAPFAILLPRALPAGYSLQSVDYTPPNTVYLQYFTSSVCDPNNLVSPEEGFIEIVESPLGAASDAKTGEEYVQRAMASFVRNGLEAESYVFSDVRMHAAGYDRGLSESIAMDENGEIVHRTEQEHAAKLWVVDDRTGTIVKIEARSTDISLDQLVEIAESLKE